MTTKPTTDTYGPPLAHTPGPWENFHLQVRGPTRHICLIHVKGRVEDDPEALANANLIAAAPAMYAALRRVRHSLDYCVRTEAVLDLEALLTDVVEAMPEEGA